MVIMFLGVRCFSCKMFQVNQQTKSGKWKCRMCGEGQSIVKVWGRGGHAKDVRGLVMELNAAAGRGEDPQTVLRRGLGEPGSQDPGRGFASNASQLRFAQGAEELKSVGKANWDRSGGFAPATGLAPDGGGGDETGIDSWGSSADGTRQPYFGDERRSEACLESARARRGGGFGAYREHADAQQQQQQQQQQHAPAWRQAPAQPAGGGGRGGSRWGVFASDRAAQGPWRHQGPGQQAKGEPNFVTSLEPAAPAARRGKKRGRHQGSPAEESGPSSSLSSSSSSSLRSRWALGGDQQEDLNHGAASVDDAEGRGEEHPSRQEGNKSRRRGWGSSTSASPRAGQVDEAPTMSSWGGAGGGFREDRAGLVAQGGGGCGGGGVSRGVFSAGESNGSGSGAPVAGGVGARGAGASSSSSRWSKFLR